MPLYERHPSRALEHPVLVTSLEGWIDAGLGAATATLTLLGGRQSDVVATFDSDELIDHRARRPVVRIADGINTGLSWPEINLRSTRDDAGNDLLFLVGPEPDIRWHAFVSSVVELAVELDVRLAAGLGAFPAAAPHTRPVRLAATATSMELAAQVGVIQGNLDVPAGVQAALEPALAEAGIPAVGLWARVPHYVSAMPYPAASAALVEGLASVADLQLDASGLRAAADETLSRVDTLIAQSSDHTEMVRQLESSIDAAEGNPLDLGGEIPSGDQIAAELERYLRGER